MERVRKFVEVGANVAIILVAILLGYTLINRYLTTSVAPTLESAARAEVIKPGTKLPMVMVDWSKSDRNLLMVLSTTCHFCSESMAFYQRLTESTAQSKGLRLIAALPQEVDEAKKYLDQHSVVVDEIVKASPGEAMVRGTPTLLLLDKNGVVLQTWIGKLPPEKENEVLTSIFSDVAGL